MRAPVLVVSSVVLCVVFVAAASAAPQPRPAGAADAAAASTAEPCLDPHPCGEQWPAGLTGDFDLERVISVRLPVPADHADKRGEKIELEGWIGIPDLPEGVRAPVALTSSPYLWDARGRGDSPGVARFWSDDSGAVRNWGVKPIELIRNGYAAAFFSVRGTGRSGGCFDFMGRDEQRDQEYIVDWLAEQPWSNGRIGMGGLSYRAVPPVAAAVHGAKPLKTIVVTGTMFDVYTSIFTPQGAIRYWDAVFTNTLPFALNSVVSPLAIAGDAGTGVAVTPERLCPQLLDVVSAGERAWLADDRNGDFWRERSFLDELDDVTAAILLVQGFDDVYNHGFQDSPVWSLTPNAPKRQITGQWGHAYPWPDVYTFDESWQHDRWDDTLFAWLDYWLKGIGTPPRLGTADYQDGHGTWHASSAWPPTEANEEVLYLSDDALAVEPAEGNRSFRSPSTLLNARRTSEWNAWPVQPWAALCPDPLSETTGTAGVAYVSEPLRTDTLIAGNPFVHLRLSSDQPGGTVRVNLAEIVGGETECTATGEPTNVRLLTAGAADLRFHTGGYTARPFGTGTPTSVRVDLWDLAETVQAGSRLVVAVMGDEPIDSWTGQPYYPEVTVHAGGIDASQIILPVVSGTTGGHRPAVAYPPRPFLPDP